MNDELRIHSGASLEKIKSDLKPLIDFQNQGISLKDLNHLIEENLIPHFMNYDHPSFQSLFNFFPEEGARWGAKIALDFNQGVTNWQVSPGGVMLEELCCEALCRLFELSSGSDATFMYCGTYSNQSALYMALHWTAEQQGFNFAEKGIQGFDEPTRLVALTSLDAHFSLKHALRTMGLGDQSLITIPVDKNRRMSFNHLKESLKKIQTKKEVFCVVATSGTTATGSIDPLLPIGKLCNDQKIWFHVDGAYGLAYSLIPDKKKLFEGIELADSITWDPHKQFGVPIPSSLLFVRRKADLFRMALFSDYFNREGDPEPNPGLKSPPSTRPLSALPLVINIRHLGLSKVIENLQSPLIAVKNAYKELINDSEIELFHKPDLGIFCLRVKPIGMPEEKIDQLQRYLYDKSRAEGKISVSMTKLDDKIVLRFVAINLNVTSKSILDSITYLKNLATRFLQ